MNKIVTEDDLPTYGIKLSNSQRRRLEKAGRFPVRVRISAKTFGYVESELLELIEARIAERHGAEAV